MHAPVEPHTPFEHDFADIYRAHYRRVFGLCRYLLNSFDAAEDATHEVFLRAQRKLDTYDPSLPFSSWLSGIATNHCIDLLRRKTTEKRIFELDAADGTVSAPSAMLSPLNELVAAERGDKVRRALSQLPEKYRVPPGIGLLQRDELRRDRCRSRLGPKSCRDPDLQSEAAVAAKAEEEELRCSV